MDVKVTINISRRAFDPCNDVAMKWHGPGMTVDGRCNKDAMIIDCIQNIMRPKFTP